MGTGEGNLGGDIRVAEARTAGDFGRSGPLAAAYVCVRIPYTLRPV
jgi:hypothetical protein